MSGKLKILLIGAIIAVGFVAYDNLWLKRTPVEIPSAAEIRNGIERGFSNVTAKRDHYPKYSYEHLSVSEIRPHSGSTFSATVSYAVTISDAGVTRINSAEAEKVAANLRCNVDNPFVDHKGTCIISASKSVQDELRQRSGEKSHYFYDEKTMACSIFDRSYSDQNCRFNDGYTRFVKRSVYLKGVYQNDTFWNRLSGNRTVRYVSTNGVFNRKDAQIKTSIPEG